MRANERQAEAWNGPESEHFVDHADRYDRQLEPFTRALLERAEPTEDRVVLDVGCGSGATTLAAAASAERVVGVDLSQPLVALARRRAQAATLANAEFVIADAQTHDFAPGTFDLIISQFGLMFFDDPGRAFTNIRRSLRAGGRAAFTAWQGLHANEWLMLIGDAVSRHVELPEFGGQARGPGMFALCEPDEITTLLGAAGFDQVECVSHNPTIVVGGGGSLDDSVDFLLGMGMPRGLLGLVDPSARDEVLGTVHAELVDRYEEGVGIRLGAAAWVVTAQA
ncbi:MAG: class I SAM-dependent methyltransferase [Acidimicrobiia bacterium]